MRSQLFGLGMCLVACSIAAARKSPVLMISIDGMRPDYVTHADEHGLKLPNLRSFLRDGTYADGVTGVFPTVTYPSHTTLVTGVGPSEHGIVNNQRFDPERVMDKAWYWYADQIKVPTLWSAAHAAGVRTASVGWPVTVDSTDIDFLIPEYWRGSLGATDNPDDKWLMNAVSRPVGEVQKIAKQISLPYMHGNETTAEGDEIKTRYAIEILRSEKPGLMTLHLSSLDEEEHLHGPFSAEADQDLEKLDEMVGRLTTQMRANDAKAVVMVVSDHGFADVDHSVNLSPAFAKAGLMPEKPGPGADWKAMPWPLGAMYAIMLKEPENEGVRAQVKRLLDSLAGDPANGIDAVLNAAQIAAAGGAPQASFVVTFRKGFTSTDALPTGDPIKNIAGHGTHGYDPNTTPEMRSSFFASGYGIAHGVDLGVIDMRQIAPTVAQILHVKLESAKQEPLPLQAKKAL